MAHEGSLYIGGVEASGFGHELGHEGLDEVLDIKATSVAPAP